MEPPLSGGESVARLHAIRFNFARERKYNPYALADSIKDQIISAVATDATALFTATSEMMSGLATNVGGQLKLVTGGAVYAADAAVGATKNLTKCVGAGVGGASKAVGAGFDGATKMVGGATKMVGGATKKIAGSLNVKKG